MGAGFEDWDHYNGAAELDAAVYVSSPSSLKRTVTVLDQRMFTLTKAAAAQSLAQGKVVDQIRVSALTTLMPTFFFRYQDASNYYFVYINFNAKTWTFQKIVAGSETTVGARNLTWTPAINTFYKVRCTFWTSEGHIWCRMEYWDGSSWIKQGDDLSDPANLWPTGGRVGIGSVVGAVGQIVWHDDTEIWG